MLASDIIKPDQATLDWSEQMLEEHGFLRSVASTENFTTAKRTVAFSKTNNLGVLVLGNVGLGKTRFLKAYEKIAPEINGRETKYFSMKDPKAPNWFNPADYGEWLNGLYECNIIIDDLGAEPTICEYGIKREYVFEFLIHYTELGKGVIAASSNLVGDKLLDRYTSRLDCLKEHMLLTIFKGKDLRQWIMAK